MIGGSHVVHRLQSIDEVGSLQRPKIIDRFLKEIKGQKSNTYVISDLLCPLSPGPSRLLIFVALSPAQTITFRSELEGYGIDR